MLLETSRAGAKPWRLPESVVATSLPFATANPNNSTRAGDEHEQQGKGPAPTAWQVPKIHNVPSCLRY